MHADEVEVDEGLAARLVAEQFPRWAGLPLTPVPSAGTDNALFRLGDDMIVRLPRIPSATEQVEKEQRWLPYLAPFLPLAIPEPLAMGEAALGYPWRWSVYRWLDGEVARASRIADRRQVALDLAAFISELHRIDATDGPLPGEHNSWRGEPLGARNDETRETLRALEDSFDAPTVTETWEAALAAPPWAGPPVWVHGDLLSENLLAVDGHLSAVIDFGCLGVGDPACDVMAAWTYLSAAERGTFREALEVDNATWVRARGWALSFGLIALPYYRQTNPVLASIAQHAIDEVLADPAMDG
jgi:aminoglycoside phosphotransferase (APT) family kinase protein